MKLAKACIATCFLIAAGGAPAMAADWGGVKDMGGGVAIPVPAPVPVPTYDADSDWYVGLMLGGNISQSASVKDTDTDYLGDSTPGYFAKDSGDLPMSPIFGLTFGRYLTPSLRAEVAIDYTPNYQISNDYKLGYVATNSAPNTTIGGIDTNAYAVSRTDTVQLSRTTGLVNLIYDFNTGTRFTPYVGGGAGFSWRRLQRSYTESATCIGGSNSIDGPYTPAGTCSGNTSLPPNSSTTNGSTSKNQINLAAAVQAGVATNLTESIIWDNGWQMLWEQGAISSVAPSASGANQIVYKDAVLQQFRSGLRIKFD